MKVIRKLKIIDSSISEDVMKKKSMYQGQIKNLIHSIESEFDKGFKGNNFSVVYIKEKTDALFRMAKLISE